MAEQQPSPMEAWQLHFSEHIDVLRQVLTSLKDKYPDLFPSEFNPSIDNQHLLALCKFPLMARGFGIGEFLFNETSQTKEMSGLMCTEKLNPNEIVIQLFNISLLSGGDRWIKCRKAEDGTIVFLQDLGTRMRS